MGAFDPSLACSAEQSNRLEPARSLRLRGVEPATSGNAALVSEIWYGTIGTMNPRRDDKMRTRSREGTGRTVSTTDVSTDGGATPRKDCMAA